MTSEMVKLDPAKGSCGTFWKPLTANNNTVVDYVTGELASDGACVIAVDNYSFLLITDQGQKLQLVRTSLLSASCYWNRWLAETVIEFLKDNGVVKTDKLKIRSLSEYLKL